MLTTDTTALVELRRKRLSRRRGNNKLTRLLFSVAMALALGVILTALTGIGAAIGVYAYYAQQLPPPEAILWHSQSSFQTTKIYDRTCQKLLWEIFDPRWGKRTSVSLDQIPLYLRQATIAAEDRDFYRNPGINIRGLLRAAYYDIVRGEPAQGGSSITQLLVKNALIPVEERYVKSYTRKIKEAILALEISRKYSKDQILEWYLNTVYFGNLAYGAEAAAQAYFGKHVQDLTLAESALLAILPQAPGGNSPFEHPDVAQAKQHLVLDAMYRDGYITYDQIVAAKAEELHFVQQHFDITAPHFVMYVRGLLEDRYGADRVMQGGLKVCTTLDLDMYNIAEEIAKEHVSKLKAEEKNVSNAGLIAIKPSTGEILTMLGSVDYFDDSIDGQVNTTLAPRQPGSAFKLFTYTTAFMQGYTPATMIMDVRTTFDDYPNPPYTPDNYDRVYHGPLRLRQALARSINIPAVKLLYLVGLDNVLDTAHRMGINTLTAENYGLSLTLGGGEVTLLDLTYAYGVMANGGVMAGRLIPEDRRKPGFREVDPVAILRVEDADGNVLEEYTAPDSKETVSPQIAYLLTSILSDNQARAPTFGTDSALVLSRPAAAKTGTTDDFRDAWTIGYTPQLVTGVWIGNTDNQPMERIPGSQGAAPIWHNFMERVLASYPVENFIQPPGIERATVDATSGLLPTEYSPSTVEEIFLQGTVPTVYDNIHQAFRICRASGKLATVYCPQDQVDTQVFQIYPPEAVDWVRENNVPQPPTEYCDVHSPGPTSGDVAITNPQSYSYVHGGVPVYGHARGPNFMLYRLEYGQGLNPSAWMQVGGDHYNLVDNGLLDVWDASQLNGLYTLQLTVVHYDNTVQQASIQVTADNAPPTVKITYPITESVFIMEDDDYVDVHAETTDDFSIDRVEFYLDDQLFAMSTIPPYNKKWTITMQSTEPVTETHLLHAIAFDAAGNQAESEKVLINIIHKPKKDQKPTEQQALLRREEYI